MKMLLTHQANSLLEALKRELKLFNPGYKFKPRPTYSKIPGMLVQHPDSPREFLLELGPKENQVTMEIPHHPDPVVLTGEGLVFLSLARQIDGDLQYAKDPAPVLEDFRWLDAPIDAFRPFP